MQALMQNQAKGYPLMGHPGSILGAPPMNRGMAAPPMFNVGLLNRGGRMPQRAPIIQPSFNRSKPSGQPLMDSQVIAKLEKLVPDLTSKPDKFVANAKAFGDMLNRDLTKQTAANFYAALEALSANIGKEEYNAVAIWRVYEYAFLKKYMFANSAHVENIAKWKNETDHLIMPKGTPSADKKHSLHETPPPSKRARTVPYVKNYNLTEVGQQVEVLQEELVAIKEEIKAFRDSYRREVDFLYQHLGVTPPAPPTPEPEPEPEVEPEPEPAVAVPADAENAEISEAPPAETSGNAENAEIARKLSPSPEEADTEEANGEK